MSKKKAFARYANNKIVPGSLIVREKAPKVGVWKEVPADLCCDGGGGNCCDPNNTIQLSFTLPGTENDVLGVSVLYIDCGKFSTGLQLGGWALPAETYSIQTYIASLNETVSPNIATFSWGGGTTVNVELVSCLKDPLCPDDTLAITFP